MKAKSSSRSKGPCPSRTRRAQRASKRTRAEIILQVESEHFNQLFEHSPVAGVIIDREGKVLRINREFTRMFGYKSKEVDGRSIDDFLVPDNSMEEAIALTAGVGKGRRMRVETVRRHKDGRQINVAALGAPVIIEDKVEAGYVIYQDITPRKRAEAELRRSEERFRVIFEGSRDAIFIADEQARLIEVNQAAAELTGYSTEELKTMRIPDLHEEIDRAVYYRYFDKIMQGTPITSEASLLRKDGRKVEAEFSNQRIQIDGISYMHTTARDITQRKAAEKALEESRDHLKVLIDSAPDIIYFKDIDLRNIIVNQAYLKAFSLEENHIIGKRDEEFMPPPLAKECRQSDKQVFRDGRKVVAEQDSPNEGGGVTTFETIKSPIFNQNGEIKGLIGISRDITERKKMENDLRSGLREKTVMLQEIHHRVKNNLQIVSSLLNLQLPGLEDTSLHGKLQETQNRIKSMALVHEQLYRSDNLERINFSEYIQRLAAHLRSAHGIDEDRVRLNIESDDVVLNITAAIPCGLIINELVSNALIHAFPKKRKGYIAVSLQPVSNNAHQLVVNDNGVGLPAGFDPIRAESMGLQLVKLLTRQLDGQLTWFSENGARFEIRFHAK